MNNNNLKVVVLCSASCQYNDGNGYYNICKHESKQNLLPYGGIDRYLVSDCDLKVKPNKGTNNNVN